ncbi:unnamed protein product [Adineta ricciae]|uniref:LysM domain-containing protein n=1 Tax=Adineta ricciae TaxID=249248 RepID=A0A813U202_ADIRI|nr:unnamed protein product [Adineta ricciae]CAF1241146.1 unnamed protein product [Adineta ricciae]
MSTDTFPTNGSMNSTEKRALSETIPNTKRSGGSYGSLSKSQLQPTFYICHPVEVDDTLQRLALKYNGNIQEIKRINKLWSDAELSLLEDVYIPVNPSQLSTLRALNPNLEIVQNISPTTNRVRRLSGNANISDDSTSSIRTSDSNTSIPTTTTTSYQDFFSKIDEQLSTYKKTLQGTDARSRQLSSQILNDDKHSSTVNRSIVQHNDRHKSNHYTTDDHASNENQREKYISAALERIQREQDDFDGL